MAAQLTGLRLRVKAISPAFLKDGVGERKMWTLAMTFDVILEKMRQGTMAHWPTRAQPDALPYIGQDRLIPPGLTESPASYAVRLQRVFPTWQLAGTPRAVLTQMLGYVLAKTPMVRMVCTKYQTVGNSASRVSTSWNTYPVGRSLDAEPVQITKVAGGNGDWDWDSLSEVMGSFRWWDGYIILYSVAPNNWIGKAAKWGSGVKWGAGTAWGVNQPASVGQGLQIIANLFKQANTWVRWIMVSFDPALFDETQPAGGGVNPDGHFGRWGKIVNGQYVPARFDDVRYGTGVL